MQCPNRALNTYRHRWILPDGTDERNLTCYLSKPIIIAQFLMACCVVSQFYVAYTMEDTASPKERQLPSATTITLWGRHQVYIVYFLKKKRTENSQGLSLCFKLQNRLS